MSHFTIGEKFEALHDAFHLICDLLTGDRTEDTIQAAIDIADTYADVLDGSVSWLQAHHIIEEVRDQ